MTAIMPHPPARTAPTLPGWLPLPDEKPGPTFDLHDVFSGDIDPENPPGPTFDI